VFILRPSVRPSFRMKQLGTQRTDFHWSLHLIIFRKSVEKIQVSLKPDKNDGYFTWRPIYVHLWSYFFFNCCPSVHVDNHTLQQNAHFYY
jgi:hypothetical protein